jgi:L-alanine-DL-glutamate epimerase-like enolase superfamily enzyme
MTRQANALEPMKLAWIEEPINWAETQDLKVLRNRIDTPIATGESMYARESFKILCDHQAVDYVHPDLATAGGILETKLIGDYAEDYGIKLALHYAGTPVSFMSIALRQRTITERWNFIRTRTAIPGGPIWLNLRVVTH